MTPVAPRIVNSVSCAQRIHHESHFSWQAQHLVILECHFSEREMLHFSTQDAPEERKKE